MARKSKLDRVAGQLRPSRSRFRNYKTPLGNAGYDNARDNIDDHVRTKAISTKEERVTRLSGMNITTVSGQVLLAPVNGVDMVNKDYVDNNATDQYWVSGANLQPADDSQTISGSKFYANSNILLGTTITTFPVNIKSSAANVCLIGSQGTGGVLIGRDSTVGKILGYNASSYNDLDIRARSTQGQGIYFKSASPNNIGIKTNSPQKDFDINGELLVRSDTTLSGQVLFTNNGKGLAHASMYMHESASGSVLCSQNNYTILSGQQIVTEGENNNITQSGNVLVVDYAGKYKIDWSVSASADNANDTVEIDIFKNETEQGDGSTRRKYAAAGDIGNSGGSAIISANANDFFELRVNNTSSSSNIVIYNMNFNMIQIAG